MEGHILKNLRYFNFERNKYFYGKLLSVDDFEAEQRYMNDKRRIINRFLHGSGVVCGMNVVLVDDITISVEMGLALDFAGREIMLEQPIMKRLSTIDGFDAYTEEDEENSFLYLCIEYDETEKEPVHSIAGAKEENGQKVTYNKYAEGYHLFLTNQEPENEGDANRSLYEESKTIYRGNGVCIKQVVPRYVQGNTEFEIKILVENVSRQKSIAFDYKLNTNCIQGQDTIDIHFDETEFPKQRQYVLTKTVKANPVSNVDAKLSVDETSFQLKIGAMSMNVQAKGSNTIHIVEGNVKKAIMNHYYENAMEEIVKNSVQNRIYLAKIAIIRAGSTYMIDFVENMPFHQYLYNNSLASVFNQLAMEEEEKGNQRFKINDSSDSSFQKGIQQDLTSQFHAASGSAVIDLGIGGAIGQKFFSEEIVHGLGLGNVHIILGEALSAKENQTILFGAGDIFEENQLPKIEMAAKADAEKGTFQIGIKCLESISANNIKIHWLAVKEGQEMLLEKNEKVMQIRPDMVNLSVRDSYYFEALIDSRVESRVKWLVREPDGGTIDENGMYIAPNKVGVYEIMASSMDYPGLTASTFVIVRDI